MTAVDYSNEIMVVLVQYSLRNGQNCGPIEPTERAEREGEEKDNLFGSCV